MTWWQLLRRIQKKWWVKMVLVLAVVLIAKVYEALQPFLTVMITNTVVRFGPLGVLVKV